MKETVLDNPAWEALCSEHAYFAQGTDSAKRYRPGIVPFVACRQPEAGDMAGLDPFMLPGESFYIIGDMPPLPAGWQVEHDLPCAQMLLKDTAPVAAGEITVPITLLNGNDANDMYQLINRVQPGYYDIDTRLMGNYYGIRIDGQLVAMAGERMRITGFTELSAICTHPGHTGKGYAQQLITQLCRQHRTRGIVSFLHVSLANERAIRLYEHMGFANRRTISFRRVKKHGTA